MNQIAEDNVIIKINLDNIEQSAFHKCLNNKDIFQKYVSIFLLPTTPNIRGI